MPGLYFKLKPKSCKTNQYYNDSKRRSIELDCSNKLSALIKGITPKNDGNLYCLNCLHSFTTKNKLKSNENICENKDFCGVVISNILELIQPKKSDTIY